MCSAFSTNPEIITELATGVTLSGSLGNVARKIIANSRASPTTVTRIV